MVLIWQFSCRKKNIIRAFSPHFKCFDVVFVLVYSRSLNVSYLVTRPLVQKIGAQHKQYTSDAWDFYSNSFWQSFFYFPLGVNIVLFEFELKMTNMDNSIPYSVGVINRSASNDLKQIKSTEIVYKFQTESRRYKKQTNMFLKSKHPIISVWIEPPSGLSQHQIFFGQ